MFVVCLETQLRNDAILYALTELSLVYLRYFTCCRLLIHSAFSTYTMCIIQLYVFVRFTVNNPQLDVFIVLSVVYT